MSDKLLLNCIGRCLILCVLSQSVLPVLPTFASRSPKEDLAALITMLSLLLALSTPLSTALPTLRSSSTSYKLLAQPCTDGHQVNTDDECYTAGVQWVRVVSLYTVEGWTPTHLASSNGKPQILAPEEALSPQIVCPLCALTLGVAVAALQLPQKTAFDVIEDVTAS